MNEITKEERKVKKEGRTVNSPEFLPLRQNTVDFKPLMPSGSGFISDMTQPIDTSYLYTPVWSLH